MHVFRRLTNLLYPPACALCRTDLGPFDRTPRGDGHPICHRCRVGMPRCGPPVCAQCGVELRGAFDAVSTCLNCRNQPRAFEMARAPWRYAGIAREALRQFKYHQRRQVGDWLSEAMSVTARACLPVERIDVVVALPSYWLTRRLRGFDPAGYLARRVSRRLRKPCAIRAVRRARWTRTQTRLSWARRARNVRGAFTAQPRLVRDRTVLLVDDVLTSGATVEACATALRNAGASRVLVLTAARTPLAQ